MPIIPIGTKVKRTINKQDFEGQVIGCFQTLEGYWRVAVQYGPHSIFVCSPQAVEIVNKSKVEAKQALPLSEGGKH